MLMLLPALLASGILFSASEIHRRHDNIARRTSADVVSMALHHKYALESAEESGFPVGGISAVSKAPFQNTRSWKSQIVSDGARKLLMTWALEFDRDGAVSWPLESGADLAVRLNHPSSRPRTVIAGFYRSTESGGHWIGNVRIPAPEDGITDGAPVIAAWVQ